MSDVEPLPPLVWVPDPAAGFLPGEIENHADIFGTSSSSTAFATAAPVKAKLRVFPALSSKSASRSGSKVGVLREGRRNPKSSSDELREVSDLSTLRARGAVPEDRDDCASVLYLHDAGILDNLRCRYDRDAIYTYTSTVLFAINPYKEIPALYTETSKNKYRKLASLHSQPPHPYAIGDLAFRKMAKEGIDQAILISGESGAGRVFVGGRGWMGMKIPHPQS